MNKQEIMSKYESDEDKLFIAKLIDKIELSQRKNNIETIDFMDMHQNSVSKKVLQNIKYTNYAVYGGYENAERECIIIYPEKLEVLFENNGYDYNNVFQIIRITLPDELKGKYTHRDYLGAIIKVGVKREKIGDILVRLDGADIIVRKEVLEYLKNNLAQLTRFCKSEINIDKIENLKITPPKTEILNIIIPSMRADSIVSEMIRTSRSKVIEIINQERVFVNGEVLVKNSKMLKENDSITVRGKGKFKIKRIINTTKKGNLVLEVEKSI